MRRLVLLSMLCLAAPLPASAASFSAVDGSALGPDTRAWHVWIGVPNIGARFLQGKPDQFDFGYGVNLNYLRTFIEPVFSVRYALMEGEEYNLALHGDTGLHWNFGARFASRNNAPNMGFRFSPGISLGMKPHPSYTTYFTVDAQLLLTWRYGGGYQLPLLAGLGAEYMITPDLNIVGWGALGPRWEGGGGYVGGTYLHGELWAGLSFRLF